MILTLKDLSISPTLDTPFPLHVLGVDFWTYNHQLRVR